MDKDEMIVDMASDIFGSMLEASINKHGKIEDREVQALLDHAITCAEEICNKVAG